MGGGAFIHLGGRILFPPHPLHAPDIEAGQDGGTESTATARIHELNESTSNPLRRRVRTLVVNYGCLKMEFGKLVVKPFIRPPRLAFTGTNTIPT